MFQFLFYIKVLLMERKPVNVRNVGKHPVFPVPLKDIKRFTMVENAIIQARMWYRLHMFLFSSYVSHVSVAVIKYLGKST